MENLKLLCIEVILFLEKEFIENFLFLKVIILIIKSFICIVG
jgi:hypothetical protein